MYAVARVVMLKMDRAMRTGSSGKTAHRLCNRRRERGIAYIGVLVLVAIVGLGLAKAGHLVSTQSQREREAQLLAIGNEIRSAIVSYYHSGEGSRYPPSLDALIEDRRVPYTLRHLRRLYRDPMTDSDEWGIVESADGGVMGVYSRSTAIPFKRRGFAHLYASFADKNTYRDWTFVYLGPFVTNDDAPVY